MTTEKTRLGDGHVSFAFNATKLMADAGEQVPWRRAALMARADKAFRHLHSLKPGGVS
jgi:hypothetical protein